jgi:putative hemolysin
LYFLIIFALTVFFLIATAFLSALGGSFRRLHLQDPNFAPYQKHFFYRPFHLHFFPNHEYEGMLAAVLSAQNVTRFFYATSALLFVLSSNEPSPLLEQLYFPANLLALFFFIASLFLFGEFLPRLLASAFPEKTLKFCAPLSSFLMILAFPITYLGLKISKKHFQSLSFEEPLTNTKRELIEIIQQANVGHQLDSSEKKLIQSTLRFKDRIAREVMVPRVDVFSLSADTSIREAARLSEEEGYSRIPLYRNNVDNIVGVLMYKDILNKYMEFEQKNCDPAILDQTVESIQKNVLYTPETKKISHLLHEFKKKQVHLAIVVDEYGGTEGIVTIEDILEEIVGDIEDEYDDEDEMFFPQPDGSWVIDARMSILDLEQQLGISIPQDGEYDTIGGYIFHCAGSIPSKGFIIHHENFDMEIIRSDERKVERVRIRQSLPQKNTETEA